MKTCKTCRHHRRTDGILKWFDWDLNYSRCIRPEFLVTSPVNGRLIYKGAYCVTERRDHGPEAGNCGPHGVHWESK